MAEVAYKLGRETGSLTNYMMGNCYQGPKPEVGMGVTILHWTDRSPATIIEVVSDEHFIIQTDNYKRINVKSEADVYSENQEYEYSPNPQGSVYHIKKCKRGKLKGQWRGDGVKNGIVIRIGEREKYHDHTF